MYDSDYAHQSDHEHNCYNAADVIRHQKLQRSASEHLGKELSEAFSDSRGLHYSIAWGPPPSLSWPELVKSSNVPLCRDLHTSSDFSTTCPCWALQQLEAALNSDGAPAKGTCPSGAHHSWLVVQIDNLCLGVVMVSIDPLAYQADPERFSRTVHMLKLIVENVCQRIRVVEAQAISHNLARSLSAHQKAEGQLRSELLRVSAGAETAPAARESSSRRLVSGIIERIHNQYAQPLVLGKLAVEAGLNAAYLSAQFSKCVGMPFRSYLKKIRLEKAEALLHDPRLRISEVANAVGYSNPNSFRLDFKRRTGLSPTAWRRTVLQPPPR
jgi:AraC-like DNA-binding protein